VGRSDPSLAPERYDNGASPAQGPLGGIDREDPEVVPAALRGLLEAAWHACRAVAANGCYEPSAPVAALEDIVAALVQLVSGVSGYVGDHSTRGEGILERAGQRLAEARADLGQARHHVMLDPLLDPVLEPEGL